MVTFYGEQYNRCLRMLLKTVWLIWNTCQVLVTVLDIAIWTNTNRTNSKFRLTKTLGNHRIFTKIIYEHYKYILKKNLNLFLHIKSSAIVVNCDCTNSNVSLFVKLIVEALKKKNSTFPLFIFFLCFIDFKVYNTLAYWNKSLVYYL